MDPALPDRDTLVGLIDDYLSGRIDDFRLAALEDRLRTDPAARDAFARYARLHTDLHLELRARQASERVLEAIAREPIPMTSPRTYRRRGLALAVAAGLLVAVPFTWWAVRQWSEMRDVAWLVNAQDCTWTGGEPPADWRAGRVVAVDRGLVEFRFRGGAKVVLEGPTRLELLSGSSVRLHLGTLAARVDTGTGFEVHCPQGTVTDLGTEFGVSVSGRETAVHVFEGRVKVLPTGASAVDLSEAQTAHIATGQVTLAPRTGQDGFIRAFIPPAHVTPRTLKLVFDRPAEVDSVRDAAGLPTGFTDRLPGTGAALAADDPNLRLNLEKGLLELTTTNSDLNTRYQLRHGEYLGVRLSDLGFTGTEDFAVSATVLNIPALDLVGQFGLYAGSGSENSVRGGLINSRRSEVGLYNQFLVTNQKHKDEPPLRVGLFETGTDLRITLRRVAGKYTLAVENLSSGHASTLSSHQPAFLDPARDLYVGVFGANTQSETSRTLTVKAFEVTVWTVTPNGDR